MNYRNAPFVLLFKIYDLSEYSSLSSLALILIQVGRNNAHKHQSDFIYLIQNIIVIDVVTQIDTFIIAIAILSIILLSPFFSSYP